MTTTTTKQTAAADQTTDSDCTCHCCGAVLSVAEARDDDSWEDGACYCAACREADEADEAGSWC